ncbi:MAG: hypothetical protein FWD73_10415 [Polyangiaceae bacterium]|nr:hypothetical protein [Polyangiaceae bacterium]
MCGIFRIARIAALVTMLLATLLVLLAGREAQAAGSAGSLDPKAIPDPLKPWTAWALYGKGDLCPTLHGVDNGEPQCVWPSRLDLTLDEKRGTFKQIWHTDARRTVPLPGDDKRWPLDVTVDTKRAVVIPADDVPSIELEPGDHVVTGSFAWDSLPESIQVPPATALLKLVLRGKAIDLPNRDAKGLVWLQKTLTAEEGERLDFVVHRRVVDEVPLLLTTRIELNVAGKSREVVLGKSLPQGFVPLSLDSQLPARVEPDTRLRVQVRPGTWTIELVARSEGPVHEIKRPIPDGPWREGEEVWVFDARTNLRLIDVQGVSAIDPQQTSLPDDWKRLPAYPLGLNDTIRLVEKRRGDAEPPPDHLTLERVMWLDFDGHGLTATDTLSGNLRRASRLEMSPPTVLGRVSIGGKDQFITHLEGDTAKTGVEVRQGDLSVSADSRIISSPSDLPAVGWNHDFHSVSATLHLPPGFRLLHATGADDVTATWIKHWTLFEIFLALVLAIGVFRLYGGKWGLIALVTLVLTFPEEGAPRYILVAMLVAEALVRAVDGALAKAGDAKGRSVVALRSGLAGLRAAVAALLVIVTVPFLIDHVRHGLFPALAFDERGEGVFEHGGFGGAKYALPGAAQPPLEPPPPEAPAAAAQEDLAPATSPEPTGSGRAQKDEKARAKSNTSSAPAPSSWKSSVDYRQFNANVYDPTSMVQTGPGRPRWSFTSVPLKWTGPVERSQRLHLYLLSPTMNVVLAIVRAVLTIALVLLLLPVRPRRRVGPGGTRVLTFASIGALALLLASPRSAGAAEVPSNEVLEQLASRLLEKPACLPTCASSSRMLIEATKGTLHIRVEIEASATTAVPLPGSSQWSPEDVAVDGKPARGLLRTDDGRLWLAVDKGWHQVTVVGQLPDRELVQIALPLKPHRVEAQADGWRVEGIHEDGLADDNLQLTRIHATTGTVTALEPGVLPPFVRVERTLLMGLDWQVTTRVVRLSPAGTAIVLEVPLLKGESVTTADIRVVGGKALLNMPPEVREVSWRSVLDQRSPVVLTAPKNASWTELWRLDMSPIWHADFSGIPVVHAEPSDKLPQWRPWPGETATLKVSRPDGVVGATLTIDESTYKLRPGLRATDATLTLQIRSSRGTQHTLTLPETSVLESVTVNGATQPIQQEGRKVTLPIAPGSQTIVLSWRMPIAIGMFFNAPAVDLGISSVNATTTITMPEGRWVLALHGSRLGPVVLFWSQLAVLLAVAAAIGAMRRAPLATWQWVLLAIGLSQVPVVAAAIVVGWLHLIAWREQKQDIGRVAFNARQLTIVAVTFVAAIVLLVAVRQGLLGHPDMQVRGNGSNSTELHWFIDRSEPVLAQPMVVSAPMLAYRVAMLAWALWLALSVIRWLRWGFDAFGQGGFWRRRPPRPPITPPPPPYMPGAVPQPWPFQPGQPMGPSGGPPPPPTTG